MLWCNLHARVQPRCFGPHHRLQYAARPKARADRGAGVVCRAELDVLGKLANKNYLDEAAKRFAAGLDRGVDEEELVAFELGADNVSSLTDLQAKYKDKLRDRLRARAEELKREEQARLEREQRNYILGQRAYERGEYMEAVKLFKLAVDDAGEFTPLGGEVQLWLALSYQACGMEKECIEMCKSVENNNVSGKVKRQAANLRYILEAPKLQINEDERVKIPLLGTDTWRQKERRTMGKFNTNIKPRESTKESSYWDRVTWDVNVPFVPDKWYYRVLWATVLLGLTVYLNWKLA